MAQQSLLVSVSAQVSPGCAPPCYSLVPIATWRAAANLHSHLHPLYLHNSTGSVHIHEMEEGGSSVPAHRLTLVPPAYSVWSWLRPEPVRPGRQHSLLFPPPNVPFILPLPGVSLRLVPLFLAGHLSWHQYAGTRRHVSVYSGRWWLEVAGRPLSHTEDKGGSLRDATVQRELKVGHIY